MKWVFQLGDDQQNRRLAARIPAAERPAVAVDLDVIATDATRDLERMYAAGLGTTDPDDYGADDARMDWLARVADESADAAAVVRGVGR